jgi:glutaredoxin
VELLVSDWCPTCPQAEQVWRAAAAERDFELAVVDLAQPEGRELAQRLRIRTIPALVIDGELKAVGVQSLPDAHRMVAAAPLRHRASPRHAGMMLSTDNRWFISTAMIWCIASGGWIAWHGALVTYGPAREIGVHLFGAGFLLSLIYGLAAHMLPRFTGNPIAMGSLPWLQYAALNAGLLAFAAGIAAGSRTLAATGGGLMWLSLLIFCGRVWPVLWPPADGRHATLLKET